MKLFNKTGLFLIAVLTHVVSLAQNPAQNLVFDAPAEAFTAASALGNGRLGALVFGDTQKERIALNEITLWSGGPQDADQKDAYKYLKPIQEALLSGDNRKAQRILSENFVCLPPGSGNGQGAHVKFGCYQTAGDLLIQWNDRAKITHYQRVLSLPTATNTVTYWRNGNPITEETWVDFANDVIWVKISSRKAKGLNFTLELSRAENVEKVQAIDARTIVLKGQLPAERDPGMQYANALKLSIKGGVSTIKEGKYLQVKDAQECIIVLNTRTNYAVASGALDVKIDVEHKALSEIGEALKITYTKAHQNSVKIFRKYYPL